MGGRNPDPSTVVGNYASGYYYKSLSRTVKCGLNASTVMNATAPFPLNACEGAAVMWKIIHE